MTRAYCGCRLSKALALAVYRVDLTNRARWCWPP
jgi:hypothetical protein